MRVIALLLLGACEPGTQVEERPRREDNDTGDADSGDPDGDPDSGETDSGNPACDAIADLPVDESYLSGFTGAEDFAFDDEGYLVSIDTRGNLVGIDQAGDQKIILTQLTAYAAGTRFLPDGDIVFCDAEKGGLVRVDPDNPAAVTVLSGLEYPNGLDVDLDGFVYVTEQNAGRLRKIDPDDGSYEIVASGLHNPNGVTFAPGYRTLYVGSFGGGVAWAIDRDDAGNWSEPRIYATTPDAPGVPPDWCETYGEGADCPSYGGYGLGECVSDGSGEVACEGAYDYAACDGLARGDACLTTRFDNAIESRCSIDGTTDTLFCPHTDGKLVDACIGKAAGTNCDPGGGAAGSCYQSDQLVLACLDTNTYYASFSAGCEGKAAGDYCELDNPVFPSVGICGDGSAYGFAGDICWPGGAIYSDHGGIDGINTDECGNLYLTEYVLGKVWRFDEEGADAQMVAKVKSSWIPNMHWGNGIGGWDEQILYVMERDRAGVYALPLNIRGHGDAYDPSAQP